MATNASIGFRADNRKEFNHINLYDDFELVLSKIPKNNIDLSDYIKQVFDEEIESQNFSQSVVDEMYDTLNAYSKIEAIAEIVKQEFEREIMLKHLMHDFVSKFASSFDYSWAINADDNDKVVYDPRITIPLVKDYLRGIEFLKLESENPELADKVKDYGIRLATSFPNDGFTKFKAVLDAPDHNMINEINSERTCKEHKNLVEDGGNALEVMDIKSTGQFIKASTDWESILKLCSGRSQLTSDSQIVFGDMNLLKTVISDSCPENPQPSQVSELRSAIDDNSDLREYFIDATLHMHSGSGLNDQIINLIQNSLKNAEFDIGRYYANNFDQNIIDTISSQFQLQLLQDLRSGYILCIENDNIGEYTCINGIVSSNSAKKRLDNLISKIESINTLSSEVQFGLAEQATKVFNDTFNGSPGKVFTITSFSSPDKLDIEEVKLKTLQNIHELYASFGDSPDLTGQIIMVNPSECIFNNAGELLKINTLLKYDVVREDESFKVSDREASTSFNINYSYEQWKSDKSHILEFNKQQILKEKDYEKITNSILKDPEDTLDSPSKLVKLAAQNQILSSRIAEATSVLDSKIAEANNKLYEIEQLMLNKQALRDKSIPNIALVGNGLLSLERETPSENVNLAIDYIRKTYGKDYDSDDQWIPTISHKKIEIPDKLLTKVVKQLEPYELRISDPKLTQIFNANDDFNNKRQNETEERQRIINRAFR